MHIGDGKDESVARKPFTPGTELYLYTRASRPAEGFLHRLCYLINRHAITKWLFAWALLRKRMYFKTKMATIV